MSKAMAKVTPEFRFVWNDEVCMYAIQVLEHHNDGSFWRTVEWSKWKRDARRIVERRSRQ